jgi:NTE family protein
MQSCSAIKLMLCLKLIGVKARSNMAKEIVLALGGGGVRGVAHLGVLRCLEENGYQVKGIAGTSAGGLFGSLYAAGLPLDEIEPVVRDFLANPQYRRLPGDRPSLVGLSGIRSRLEQVLGDRNVEDFPIAFAATAVSLKSGEEIVITRGSAVDAVLATVAIPGIFPSRGSDDEYLVDGGVLDPVPIQAARHLNPSLPVVAVVLHRKPPEFSPRQSALPLVDSLPQPLVKQLSKTRLAEVFQSFYAAVEVITDRISEQDLIISKPDVVVAPLVGHYSTLGSVDADALMAEGQRAMQAQLNALADSLSLINSVKRIARYTEARDD